jgi:hypothetical protein
MGLDDRKKQAERKGTNPGPGSYSVDTLADENIEEM